MVDTVELWMFERCVSVSVKVTFSLSIEVIRENWRGGVSHKELPVGSSTATEASRVGTGSTQIDVEGRIKIRWLAIASTRRRTTRAHLKCGQHRRGIQQQLLRCWCKGGCQKDALERTWNEKKMIRTIHYLWIKEKNCGEGKKEKRVFIVKSFRGTCMFEGSDQCLRKKSARTRANGPTEAGQVRKRTREQERERAKLGQDVNLGKPSTDAYKGGGHESAM